MLREIIGYQKWYQRLFLLITQESGVDCLSSYGIALLELAKKESEEARKKNTEGQVFSTHF